jgi:Fe-S cluster assembly protein SufD
MEVAEAQDLYLNHFDRLERIRQSDPSWLRELRRASLARFRAQQFPTTRDEDFRSTPVALASERTYEPAFDGLDPHVSSEVRALATVPGLTASELVFVNGRYSHELSNLRALPDGVRVTSLAAALVSDGALLQKHLHQHINFETQGFTALNAAFLSDGAIIYLPDNAVVEEPIHLVFLSQPSASAPGGPFVAHPRTLVVAGRHAQAQIIETFAGRDAYFTNATTEIVCGEGSHIKHYRVQRESLQAAHIAGLHVDLARTATFTSHSIVLGGALVRNDVNAKLDAEGIVCTLNGLYIVDGKRIVDNHTAIDHAKPHCESHELYKGILDDQGRGVFNGKIFVRQDAQKTDAKQTNQVLLLSDDATINTKPQLEIFADDVKCTHGATIGQLSKEQLFYLRARGIGADQAQAILVHAFAGELVERIDIAPLRDQLEEMLLSRLPI